MADETDELELARPEDFQGFKICTLEEEWAGYMENGIGRHAVAGDTVDLDFKGAGEAAASFIKENPGLLDELGKLLDAECVYKSTPVGPYLRQDDDSEEHY